MVWTFLLHFWQLYCLIPLCRFSCFRRSCFRENDLLQIWQPCGFSPVCPWMCFKPVADERNYWHKLHLNGVSFLCVFLCLSKSPLCTNVFSHWSHLNFLKPLCCNWCLLRVLFKANDFFANGVCKWSLGCVRCDVSPQTANCWKCFVAQITEIRSFVCVSVIMIHERVNTVKCLLAKNALVNADMNSVMC